jgi:hypothetical protein
MEMPVDLPNNFADITGNQFTVNGVIYKLKGANYYPREHMWTDMWNNWDWPDILSESTMIDQLGLNCVRILLPYDTGGWGGPTPPEERLQKLEDLVNRFGSLGIRSVITLFDWEPSFPAAGTGDEADHFSHITAICGRLRNNPYVLAWDVKNEPDHPNNYGWCDCNPGDCGNWDCNPTQRDRIVSWIDRMTDKIREVDPFHPVSAGMRWWENIPDVLSYVDFAIFHSYWSNIDQQITETIGYMSTNQLPIVVEEWGWPTHPYPANQDGTLYYGYNETAQLNLYTSHLTAFTTHDISGGLQWMAFDAKDYNSDPDESYEHYFGLWRYNLTLKPGGVYYRDNFPVTQFPN